MIVYNKNGKEKFEIDDLVLIICLCIIAFIIVGHC